MVVAQEVFISGLRDVPEYFGFLMFVYSHSAVEKDQAAAAKTVWPFRSDEERLEKKSIMDRTT